MRLSILLLFCFLSSCSLLLQGDDALPDGLPSIQGAITLSVNSDYVPYLLTEEYSAEKFPVVISRDGGGFCSGTIRLRGQTTLDWHPRSFSIDIRQDSTVDLQAQKVSRLNLIPFRSDTNFIYSLMGFYFAKRGGYFTPEIDITALSLNGKSLGTYTIFENSTDAMVRVRPETEFVLRRRYGNFYDLKYYEPKDSVHQLTRGDYTTSYETLHTLYALYQNDELVHALKQRMDLDKYFQMQAFNVIFSNGDYHDELFYCGSARDDWQGIKRPYFQFSIWDLSELFTEPHLGHFTPGSLIFCNENRFDRMIESTPYLYEQYVQVVYQMLESEITTIQLDSCWSYIERFIAKKAHNGQIFLGEKHYSTTELKTLFEQTVEKLMERKQYLLNRIK